MLRDHIQSAAGEESGFPSFFFFFYKHSLSLPRKDDTEQVCCPKWQKSRTEGNPTGAQRSNLRVHPPTRQSELLPSQK